MIVRRFYDERLAQASYLIGCERVGEGILIDPARDVSPYLAAARQEHLRITRVAETHIHADFASGTRQLAAETGAVPHLSAEGGPDWQYQFATADGAVLLHDGDTIVFGGVRLDLLHTPGHTPEHLAFIVTDLSRSNEPVAILSGDFLFVGDVGRPDLLERAAGVADSKRAAARALFKSLRRMESFPDYLQVWPGHGAGSACGKALGSLPSSTLGYERRTSWAFAATDEAAFVESVLEGQSEPPIYFAEMKRLNRAGPPILSLAELPILGPDAFGPIGANGFLLDVRPGNAFAEEHLEGWLNIPLSRAFTKWAGWLVPYDRDVYLLASDPAAGADARAALASIGLDRVKGVFGPDLIATARQRGSAISAQRVPMAEVKTLQQRGVVVVDVRDPDEWDAGHLDGAKHHPLGTLPRAMASVDRSTPVAVHCAGGSRSGIGASMLEQMGFRNVTDLTGGWSAWNGIDG
ncbi:MAG TPA: MBL fold metallo-hydrolase [Gemmatimonadales bacterium]|jgi:hydroxyacylglutathione hydrolase